MVRILLELFEMLYVIICVHLLYGERMRLDIYNIVYILFASVVLEVANKEMLPYSSSILLYTGLYIYCLVEFGRRFAEALVNCVLAVMIIGIFQLVFYFPTYMIIGELGNMSLERLIIHICSLAAIILLNRLISLHTLSEYFLKKEFILWVIFAITLLFFAVDLLRFKNMWTVSIGNYAFAILFLGMVLIMAFQWQKARSEAEQRAAELRMQEMCNSSFAELITQVRMRQHDFRNHLSALRSMQYTSSSLEELREKQDEYCQYIEEENKFNRLLSAEGNRSMVGFLYSKFLEADKKGVTVDYEIRIGDLVSAAGVYSLMEVAGILLDNAVEAVAEKDGEERAIRCSLTETGESIRLQVGNVSRRYRQDEMERFFRRGYSTKGNGRGLGLENVKRIMERSRSEMSVDNRAFNGVNYLVFELVVPR